MEHEPTSIRFAQVARALTTRARAEGLAPPSFRSPPGVHGEVRTVRRRRDGTSSVAVATKGRPWPAVLADMVEGVLVVNELRGPAAARARAALWQAAAEVEGEGAAA